MQRFLTEARWSDETVIGRLQEYLAPRLGHPEAVWVFDGSDFPKQGRKSVGVARQYCGRLGKVANCQGGMFLAYVSPLGRALVDKRLYLPKSWTSDQDRCAAAGVPEDRRNYRSKTELALEMLERVLELGYLRAEWVAGDDAFGMSPTFREGLAALGMRYVLDVPGDKTGIRLLGVARNPANGFPARLLVGLRLGPGVISLIGQFNDSATFLHGLPASQVEHVHLSGSGEGLHFQEYIPTPQSDSQSPMEGVLGSLIVTSHAAQIPAAS